MSRTTDIILEISRANITPDGSKNNLFTIKYNNGSLNVDLAILLPCSDSDFKRLTAFIDKIDDYTETDNAVLFVWRYVSAMQAELSRIKESYPDGDTKSRAECQRVINRFDKYAEILRNAYGYMLPEETESAKPAVKRQRMKTADIYTIGTENGQKTIKVYPGKLYIAPDGITYGIANRGKADFVVIDIYTGLQCSALSHSAAECIETLTPDLLAKISALRTGDKYNYMAAEFVRLMNESGYSDYITPYETETAADKTPKEAETPHNNVIPRDCIAVHCVMHYGDKTAEMLIKKRSEFGRNEWIYTDSTGADYSVFIQHIRNAGLCEIIKLYRDGETIPETLYTPEPAPAPASEQDNTPAEAEQAEQAEPYNIDYDALLRRFGERYAQLYDMNGAEYDWQTYRDALNIFDNGMNPRDKATLLKFVELRRDYVSSDREAAAFIMALIDVLNAPGTPETAPESDNSILPAETETAPETAPETAENAPECPIIEFKPELLEISRYFFSAVFCDTLSADGVQYIGSECGTRGNRLRIYVSGSEYETPETVYSNAELYSFMIDNILNAEDYSYLSGIGQHYYELLAAYTPEPPAPEPATGAGTPAGIAGTPADTTGGTPAGMQAETTGGTAGTPETTAAGIAPAHYITAALYPDPVIIAGIPPALYNLPRRNKTASALLYNTPVYMRHRRHAARIKAINRAPPARKTERRQRIRGRN